MRMMEESVLLGAATAYMDMSRDAANLEVQQNNIRVLQRTLRDTQNRFSAGQVTATDVAQAEAQLCLLYTSVVPPERESTIGYGSFDRVMKTLEDAVSSKNYLVGDNFTAADVYCGYALGFGLMFGTIEKRPAFERYWDRLKARPAFARARQIDDALTPKAAS